MREQERKRERIVQVWPWYVNFVYDIYQLIIIHSFPESNRGQEVLQKMYSEKNKNRTRPCMQSRSDAFRILLYDVATAADNSNHTHPLLLRRHNVIAGMFLVCFHLVISHCINNNFYWIHELVIIVYRRNSSVSMNNYNNQWISEVSMISLII